MKIISQVIKMIEENIEKIIDSKIIIHQDINVYPDSHYQELPTVNSKDEFNKIFRVIADTLDSLDLMNKEDEFIKQVSDLSGINCEQVFDTILDSINNITINRSLEGGGDTNYQKEYNLNKLNYLNLKKMKII